MIAQITMKCVDSIIANVRREGGGGAAVAVTLHQTPPRPRLNIHLPTTHLFYINI